MNAKVLQTNLEKGSLKDCSGNAEGAEEVIFLYELYLLRGEIRRNKNENAKNNIPTYKGSNVATMWTDVLFHFTQPLQTYQPA